MRDSLLILRDFSQSLAASADLKTIADKALESAIDASGAEVAELFLIEKETRDSLLVAHKGLFSEAFSQIRLFKLGLGFPGLIAARGEPIVTRDLQKDERYLRDKVKKLGFSSYICYPLEIKGHIKGCINIASRNPRAFRRREMKFLSALSPQLSLGLEWDSLKQAALMERKRIIQELHDGLAAQLTLLRARAELLTKSRGLTDKKIREEAFVFEKGLKDALKELRLILTLSPSSAKEGMNFINSLEDFINRVKSSTGLYVELEREGDLANLPQGISHTFLHIVREAFQNIVKHSRADKAYLRLKKTNSMLDLNISDNGIGFDKEVVKPGLGLALIQEKVRAYGGSFSLESSPGNGCIIDIALPLQEKFE